MQATESFGGNKSQAVNPLSFYNKHFNKETVREIEMRMTELFKAAYPDPKVRQSDGEKDSKNQSKIKGNQSGAP